ncbi:MAG: hypothetical protein Q8Q90_03680 [bacterium]|nr:hypothetical protein [bacterium]
MFKSINLYKLVSVGLLSVFLFAFSFAVVGAQAIPPIESNPNVSITSIEGTAVGLINYVIGIIAIVAVVMIVYAGYLYISSGGDEKKLGQAKSLILYAVIGLVVVIVSYSIVGFVNSLIGP